MNIVRLTANMPPQVRSRAHFLQLVTPTPDVADVQRMHRDGVTTDELARLLEVDVRTIQRYLQERTPCPGERCLTMVRGGGLCSFCRRSR